MRNSLCPVAAVAALLTLGSAGCQQQPTGRVRAVSATAIEFQATVSSTAFDGAGDMAGYHLIVWRGGRAAHQALLQALVTDVQVLDALEELGAAPGNGLSIDSWDERYDDSAAAPDLVIAGPAVEVEILVPGRDAPLSLAGLLEDAGGRGFEMRFGGHRDNIPDWHSGCVVCLYSCPGSKVGNARYTVRDFVRGATHFRVRDGALPPDGTEVTVRFSLQPEVAP